MAYNYLYGDDKERAYAESIWNLHAVYFTRVEQTRGLSRFRVRPGDTINGQKIHTAQTGHAFALINQFCAFANNNPVPEVIPKDNTDAEDRHTSRIEKWLEGVPRAASKGRPNPYAAFLFNAAEVGRGYLLTEFDEYRALAGQFPFRIKSPDPAACAFQIDDNGVVCFVMKETRQVEPLLRELEKTYAAAAKPKWTVPSNLRDLVERDPVQSVEVVHLYTEETHTLWVQKDLVWRKPHLMGCVPVSMAFCLGMPSDKVEEMGMGLVYPSLDLLVNEQGIMSKAYTGFEFFTFPLVKVTYQDGAIEIVQARPGMKYPNAVAVEQMPVVPNFQILQMLMQHSDTSINRVSMPEVSFGDDTKELSGFAYSQLLSGPMARIEKMLESLANAWAEHYALLLDRVEYFATSAMAKQFGAKGEEAVTKYLEAFGTVSAPTTSPAQKKKSKVILDADAVGGYRDVSINLVPELPSDENAKYQRAQLARQVGLPMEYVLRDILKVESPDQVMAWMKKELIMQVPMYQDFILKKGIKDTLNDDPKLAREFNEYEQAEQMQAQADAQMQAQMGHAPEMQGQGMQGAEFSPDMTGLPPEMLPPAMSGQTPPNPMDALMAQSFQG